MIIDDIMEWITTLPNWEQKLAYKIIDKRVITEGDIDEIYQQFKIEMKLQDGEILNEEKQINAFTQETNPSVTWIGVGNVHGVNRLQTGSTLQVSKGLTIVYGENGSGKSGYTRLLNNAFISRGDQVILPNVFSDNPENVSADFIFEIDEKREIYKYPEKKGAFPFRIIRNFDSQSAADDMNNESTIDFAPSELSFFDVLLSSCVEIQKKLDNERIEKKKENPTLQFFTEEGKAQDSMKAISANSKVEKIKEEFAVTDEDEERYIKTHKEKLGLIALDINKQIYQINLILNTLSEAAKKYNLFVKAISDENIEIYNEQIEHMKKYKLIRDQKGIALFENDGIEKLGSIEWKEFIISAKRYYDSISQHDKCPLCGHSVNENDLIYKYWIYLESDAEKNYKTLQTAVKLSIVYLKELDLSFLDESSMYKQWLMENFKDETIAILELFNSADKKREQLIQLLESNNKVDNKDICTKPEIIQTLITQIIDKRENLNQASINKRIEECTLIEKEYTEKTKVNGLIPVIESYIEYLKWEKIAEKSSIKTRHITNKQTELFGRYVTDDYLRTFKEECQKLDAELQIDIIPRGKHGQTVKKLTIKGIEPGRVLSEGEQRAVSIANFLTEVQMDNINKGIVLDDPVCSLDHKRRHLIVDRLLEEAKKRQVIVFTHEITFFMELKTMAEEKEVNFLVETIRKYNNEPGQISDKIPWQGMNVKDRIKKLRRELQEDIEPLFKAGDNDEYCTKAKTWCELLRESWERSVEEILFNDAIQRYNPCVQTQRLKRAPFTKALYDELCNGMTTCSAWCHDQARAINGRIPDIKDLKSYIQHFDDFCTTNRP